MVQWLKFQAPNAGGMDSIPGGGTKILHMTCDTGPPKKIAGGRSAGAYVNLRKESRHPQLLP